MRGTTLALAFVVLSGSFATMVSAQSGFDVSEYRQFLLANQNLTTDAALANYSPLHTYYKGRTDNVYISDYAFMGPIVTQYELTDADLAILESNHFIVSERLSFNSFGSAFYDVYAKDLPVFVSTDAVLHALHASYDLILLDLERFQLEPALKELLDALYVSYPELLATYGDNAALQAALADVDVYVTVAKSLLEDRQIASQFAAPSAVTALLEAVASENLVTMPLFSESPRRLDFSQFIVRGHYNRKFWDPVAGEERTLGEYFKCMMWLGRMDFWLTPPPACPGEPTWDREAIRRMALGAVMLNELVDLAGARPVLDEIDSLIELLVSESDNLTPAQLCDVTAALGIDCAGDLLDESTYDAFNDVLTSSAGYGQRILSCFLVMDPFNPEPEVLPVSFRLVGQRFIIDSYVLGNVVYPNIIYESMKIWRGLPDPLDAMFVLGNDDALPLLRAELDQYHYASQLSGLRYLVDAYDDAFWDLSLYNTWLEAIRCLNPPADRLGFPFFMTTAAWHQEKLNTQLASWAQLRHDNLLYAKQSYTGGAVCSYPYSFVEPYPEFYCQVARFAENARAVFATFCSDHGVIRQIRAYFTGLQVTMDQLEIIAQKELSGEALSAGEAEFLAEMLFESGGACRGPPFSGWYPDLFYDQHSAAESDYIIADVHTQPTDAFGGIVGRVLHVGVGRVNLGVFLAEAASGAGGPVAFVGPVMSYYEKVTDNFARMTDEEWTDLVDAGELPRRPDWVNIYLTGKGGEGPPMGRELESVSYPGGENPMPPLAPAMLLRCYPNPFCPATTIMYALKEAEHVRLEIVDVTGRAVATLVDRREMSGKHSISWDAGDLPSGIYFARLQAGSQSEAAEIMLVR